MADAAGLASPMFRSTLVGTVLQVGMVLAGHYIIDVKEQFALGGMSISAVAGLLYSLWAKGGSATDAIKGGAVAGGGSAFLGILISTLLGDVPATVLAFGTAGSAVTGLIGGLVGRAISKPAA